MQLTKINIIIILICIFFNVSYAQKDTTLLENDTLSNKNISLLSLSDTTKAQRKDTISLKYSSEGLEEELLYTAEDSAIIDNEEDIIRLYGIGRKASLKYLTFNLKADVIEIDRKQNLAIAYGVSDTTGKVGRAEFNDGQQTIYADHLKYNFKTKKGIISGARSKQNDLYVISETAKLIPDTTELSIKIDTSNKDKQVIYNKNAFITTCNAEHPHFGIRTTKLKVLPDKVAVIGPSLFELGGVPTPIVLPFGVFPISKNKKMGILFPRNFENSPSLGLGILNIGYYIPISDRMDVTVYSDIYFRGTIRLTTQGRYLKRYKYNGNLNLGVSRIVTEGNDGKEVSNFGTSIQWSHSQAATAHPTRSFGGSVNIQTNGFQRNNRNDYRSVVSNTLSSNLNYRQTFPGKPYSLSASFQHSQNIDNHIMTIEFPNIDFNVNTIFPFKNSKRVGTPKWYDNIALVTNAKLQNRFQTTDTTLFTSKTIQDAKFGLRHDATLNASFLVAKYFLVTPYIRLNDVWYLKTLSKSFDESKKIIALDTTYLDSKDSTKIDIKERVVQYGKIDTTINKGISPFLEFNTGLSLSTKVFGTTRFKKGWLRGLRHVMTPSVSLNYNPNYTTKFWNYFDTLYYINSTGLPDKVVYSYFEGGVFGTPNASGQSMILSWNVSNNFEMKYRNRKDTADTKFKLIDNLSFSGNYNLLADSFKISNISFSTNTNLFKGYVNLSINGILDPYAVDYSEGKRKRLKITEWEQNRRLVNLNVFNLGVYSHLTFKQIREMFSKKQVTPPALPTPESTPTTLRKGSGEQASNPTTVKTEAPNKDYFWYLLDNFSFTHSVNLTFQKNNYGRDTLVLSNNNLSMSGEIKITPKWSVRVGHIGYDFQNKSLTYPDLSFYRDLHCWEIGGSWQPQRGTYSFFLRVKPGTFGFFNLPYNKTNPIDGFRGF